METLMFIDFETYSSVNLRDCGAYPYMASPDFAPLIMTYRYGVDGQTKIAQGEAEIKWALRGLHEREHVTFVAHNANFERLVLSRIFDYAPGTFIPPERFIDTMAMGRSLGFPGSLADLARALHVEEKDSAGTALIQMFCVPSKKTGRAATPEERPEEWAAFCRYAVQDVDTMVEVYTALTTRYGGFPKGEREVWNADQRINDRGILVDAELAVRCMDIAAVVKDLHLQHMGKISGLANPNSTAQVLAWVNRRLVEAGVMDGQNDIPVFKDTGAPLKSVDKASVAYLLSRTDLPRDVRTFLEERAASNAASVAKFKAMTNRLGVGNRVRGTIQYFGAHTGRWAGRGVQLQNLPSVTAGDDEKTQAFVDRVMNEPAENFSISELKPLIRGALMAPAGQTLTVCDYSAIEARVLAWLAGEEWVLEAFRAGRDIYIETAARMFHVPYEEARPLRKKGKVAVLALGYGGGINALKAMGAEGTDAELEEIKQTYRAANPRIAKFWADMDRAMRNRSGRVGEYITVHPKANGLVTIKLPSARELFYHKLHFRTVAKFDKEVEALHFLDPKSHRAAIPTYGGRLTENVTQAVARDVLAHALVNLDKENVAVVAHVHDEVIAEGGVTVERMKELMGAGVGNPLAPPWADGLPLAAEGYYCARYRKE
jgi:DNA polymerase|nr:MAG TPA: DNA polymerase I [Caudoviricetes sp.]